MKTNQIVENILVVLPHAGFLIPKEIDPESLSDAFMDLVVASNDLYTDILYNLTERLGNKQIIFPYTPAILNVNKDPNNLDSSVPLTLFGSPVYKPGREPDTELRKLLIHKYHLPFHRKIRRMEKSFILDAHSTMDGDRDKDGSTICDDIILDDFQATELDPAEGSHSAPPGFVETYANELTRLLPASISVKCNSHYTKVYGHTMAVHSWDGRGEKGRGVPLILQETNERLYVENGIPSPKSISELQQVFSEALAKTTQRMEKYLI